MENKDLRNRINRMRAGITMINEQINSLYDEVSVLIETTPNSKETAIKRIKDLAKEYDMQCDDTTVYFG